jgi:uncharacterized protein DUF2334
MNASYLVRFDDICPTTNWNIWNKTESAFLGSDLKPIMAVVHNNQAPELQVALPLTLFWDKVRQWKERGSAIGLHTLNHRYVTRTAGMLGRNNYSEFAGLPATVQEEKLAAVARIRVCGRGSHRFPKRVQA